jgi:EAL domain-containing protein (putative c-di-GMP-specific phosphodiesterase class I)
MVKNKGETEKTVHEPTRQTATTIEGAAALNEPIVYFYTVGVNIENKVEFVKSRQMLNDRFLGKLIPEHYVSVSELSERAQKLNALELKQTARKCNIYKDVNFVVTLCAKSLLTEDGVNSIIENGKVENKNMVLSFDAQMLEVLDDFGKLGVAKLRAEGFKIMLENVENAPIKVIAEYDLDFIRLDFRFYKQRTVAQMAQATAITNFAKSRGIKVSCAYIKHMGEVQFMLSNGADIAEGFAFGDPKRRVLSAMEERRHIT